MARPTLPNGPYRAHVGDTSYDLTLQDGQVHRDGHLVEVEATQMEGHRVTLRLNGRSVPTVVEAQGDGQYVVTVGHRRIPVRVQDARALLLERFGMDSGEAAAAREVRAPMPGLVLRVPVEAGQAVEAGTSLLVLEAMKMENELRAEAAGTIEAVHVSAGEAVSKNALLISFAD
ncbi:MAG: biotin/lipoyl-containing protein [Bacteroidota bacterium]